MIRPRTRAHPSTHGMIAPPRYRRGQPARRATLALRYLRDAAGDWWWSMWH